MSNNYIAENNKVENVFILGNLFQKDAPKGQDAPIFSQSIQASSTRNFASEMRRNTEFSTFQRNPMTPLRCCCMAGNELPILTHNLPSTFLSEHWKKWCPHFTDPVVQTTEDGIADENTLITLFPLSSHFPLVTDRKTRNGPEMHYHILKKSAVAETGAPHPKYFTEENVEFRCMIKIDQSLGGFGNFVTKDREEFMEKLEMVNNKFGEDASYIISEYIQD